MEFWKQPTFWTAALGPVVSLLVAKGVISINDKDAAVSAIANAALGCVYLIAQAIAIHKYLHVQSNREGL